MRFNARNLSSGNLSHVSPTACGRGSLWDFLVMIQIPLSCMTIASCTLLIEGSKMQAQRPQNSAQTRSAASRHCSTRAVRWTAQDAAAYQPNESDTQLLQELRCSSIFLLIPCPARLQRLLAGAFQGVIQLEQALNIFCPLVSSSASHPFND